MPAGKYRQKLETADCLQYDGSNNAEMLAFAPGFVIDQNGTLMIARNPFPLLATEWVLKDVDDIFQRLDDAGFQRHWERGV